MNPREPSNIPNKFSRELNGRLIPRQKIRNHPVTFVSTLSKNHARVAKTVIQQRPKKLIPLAPLPDEKPVVEEKPKTLPLTKDPLEYIRRAKLGLDTREYVYLEQSPIIEDSEHPTCLRIIPAKYANDSNFWTLSLKGMTHFNRPTVDFIPLEQWLRETDLFSKILTIPFFKYQRQWRHFKMWHRNIQNTKLVKAQNSLTTNLFFANPILRPSFIKIQRELNNLRNVKLYTIDPKKIYSVRCFEEENAKYRTEILKKFEDFFNTLVSIVASACEKSLDNSHTVDIEKDENGSPLDRLIAQYEKAHKTPEAKSTYETPGTLKYTNKATHNALCQLAVRFIRMVDYVVVNSLKNICSTSMLEMYSTLSSLMHRGSEKNGYKVEDFEEIKLNNEWQHIYDSMVETTNSVFSTPIFAIDAFYDNGLKWEPAMNDLISRVEVVRKESIRMLFTIPRLISYPVFKPYIVSVIESGLTESKRLSMPDIVHIIQGDSIYKDVTEKQKKIIEKSYDILNFYSQKYQSSVEMFEKNSTFNVKFLEKEDITAKEIRDVIQELVDQETALKEINDYGNVGIFQCCMVGLKKFFMNSPSNCIEQVKKGIQELATKSLTIFREKVHTAYDELSVKTENVEQFVAYIDAVKSNRESIYTLYHLHKLLGDLYKLSKDKGIDIPQAEQNEYQELCPVFDAIKRYLSYSEDNTQQLMPKFTSSLEKSVSTLHSKVIEVVLLANNTKLSSLDTSTEEASKILEEVVKKTEEMDTTAKQYNTFQTTMGITRTDFDDVKSLVDNVELTKLLWDTKIQWIKKTSEWCETPFASIDSEKMVEEIHSFVEKANKAVEGLSDNNVAKDLKEKVDHFSTMVPIISDLKNPALKQSHTEQIEQLLGDSSFEDPEFKFGKLVDLKAYLHVAKISEISMQATNEQVLLDQLNIVKNNIEALQFITTPIKNYKNTYYLEGIDTINIAIDDALSMLASIRSSKYVAQHRARAEEWSKSMRQFQQSIETVNKCQSQWCYLADVFSNIDISRQLPVNAKELSVIERNWKSFSGRAFDDPYAFKLCSTGNLIAELAIANQTMEGIRRNLEQFLDTKRAAFPRLYLLSNREFINLLSKPKDVNAIIPYLPKLFTGVKNLEFITDGHIPSIAFVVNDVDERVQIRPVKYHANVETWLQGLCESLQKTVKNDIRTSQEKYNDMVREDWIQVSTTQCVLIVSALARCESIEEALNSGNPIESLRDLEKDINQSMTNLIRFTHLDLRPVEQNKIESLMLSDMFYQQIVSDLITNEARSEQDPYWVKQMVYRWDEGSKELVVTQCYESFKFGYEYTGKSTRFVQTPNVWNSFMQISSALKAGYNAALIGDSLIGKTETILSLAEALGYFVAMRTCTETITSSQITNIVKGAAQGGYWVCFENFNCLRPDVLSAVSEEFQAIKNAKEAQLKKFELDGFDVQLDESCGLFVTVPNTQDYYKKIPENLKNSLRPINLYPIENAQIVEPLLLTLGFIDASNDSDLLNVIFTYGRSVVSQQAKSFLSFKTLIEILYEGKRLKASLPNSSESEVLANAITSRLLPQLPKEDQKILMQLIDNDFDIIPEVFEPVDKLSTVLSDAITKCQLEESEYLSKKVMDLHSEALVHQAIIIAGDPCSGKSSIIRILEEARNIMHDTDDTYSMIDKLLVTPGMHENRELFGFIDQGKYNDGVVGKLLNSYKQLPEHEPWIIFDGEMSPSWTDVIISAFDNQHLISLNTGSTCLIPPEMKFIFETNDISKANPSILGRCALITTSSKDLGIGVFVKTALDLRIFPTLSDKPKVIERINEVVKETIAPGLDFIKENMGLYAPFNFIDTLFSFFALLIKGQNYPNNTEGKNIVSSVYAYAYLWAFGGFMNNSQRLQFESFVRDSMGSFCPTFPTRGILFDFSVNLENGRWSTWQSQLNKANSDEGEIKINPEKEKLLVQTPETMRMKEVLKLALSIHRNIIFTGAPASGRSSIITSLVGDMKDSNKMTSSFLSFSKLTTGEYTQTLFMRCLERIGTKFLQPRGRVHGIIVVDRMNDPIASEPLEILRSLFKRTGLRPAPTFQTMPTKNMSIIGIASLAPINLRVAIHAYTLQYTAPDTATLTNILAGMLSSYMTKNFDESIRLNSAKYAQTLAAFHSKLVNSYDQNDAPPQLKFNIHSIFAALSSCFATEPKKIMSADEFGNLLLNQIVRTYSDRITVPLDKKYFEESLIAAHKIKFTNELNMENIYKTVFADLTISQPDQLSQTFVEYKEEELTKPLETIIKEYCDSRKTQTERILPLTASGVHVARLIKVLKTQRSNAIIFGNVGTGKTTVSRLALFAVGSDIVEATGYNDIRTVINKVGVNGKKVTLVVRNNVLKNKEFCNGIETLLSTENPLQFLTLEDIDKGCNELVFYAKTISEDESVHTLKSLFVNRIHEYLHVLFIIDSDDLSMFKELPDVIPHCIVDHFDNLPDESLKSIASATFSDLKDCEKITDAAVFVHHTVLDVAQKMQKRGGNSYIITPSIFVSLLSTFKHIVKERTATNKILKQKYSEGTKKIKFVTDFLETTEKLLIEIQPKYDRTTEDADVKLHYINENEVTYEKVSQRLIYEKKELEKKEEEVKNLERKVQDQIDVVYPQLKNAIAQLKGLNRGDIMDLKSISDPPIVIRTVMEVICILSEVDLGWKSSIQLLSDPTFINRISSKYGDTKHVSPDIMARIKPYVESNPNFQESEVGRVSVAAKSLCVWATALYNYEIMNQTIQPDLKLIESKKSKLNAEIEKLEKRKEAADLLSKTIQDLKDKYDKTNKEKRELSETITTSKTKIENAKKLLRILKDEDVLWKSQYVDEEKKSETLFYDAFICASIIVYFGPLTTDYRTETLNRLTNYMNENKMLISPRFSFIKAMADSQTVRQWIDNGIPDDITCLETAAIIMNTEKAPFILDKTGIISRFIKNIEESMQITIIRPTTHNFLRTIENSIKLGIPILIEDNDDKFDPALEQLSLRKIYKQESKNYVKLGDRIAECDENYKFYMTVPIIDNPSSQAFTKASVVNFEVTKEALAKHELQHIIAVMNPSLAKNISNIKDNILCEERAIQKVHDRLLELMRTTSEEQILEDDILITTIEASKQSLYDSTKELRKCQDELDECIKEKAKYLPISQRIALIYEAAASFAKTNNNYYISHSFISHIVDSALAEAKGNQEDLINNITFALFESIARAMKYEDQLKFALTFATHLSISERRLSREEFYILLNPPKPISIPKDSPIPEISKNNWHNLCALCSSLKVLKHIPAAIEESKKQVAEWYKSHSTALPPCISEGLTEFQCLLLQRALKPGSFESVLRIYIEHSLGKEYANPITFDLSKLITIAGSTIPIIITLNGPVTAASYIMKLSQEKKLHVMSLGEGQSKVAEKALTNAMQRGEWLLLENCEYLPSFITELDNILAKGGANENFLLFLSTKDVSKFPPRLLNLAVKCTLEPPHNTKNSIIKSLESLPKEFFSGQLACRISLAYAAAHASLIARTKFKDLSFAEKCVFNDSDFKYIMHFVKPYITIPEQYSYKVIRPQVAFSYAGHSRFNTDRDTIFALLDRMLDGRIVVPNSPILGITEISPIPDDKETLFEFVNELTDEEIPQLYGLPSCSVIKGTEIPPRRVPMMERFMYLESIIKKLPEIDNIVPEEVTDEKTFIDPVDVIYQRNAMNEIQAIAKFKQIKKNSETSLWDRKIPEDILALLPWPNPLDSFLNRMAIASETFNSWWRKSRPAVIDLRAFSDPRGFLGSVIIKHSLSNNIPVRGIFLAAEIPQSTDQPADIGIYVTGLSIVGAKFDTASELIIGDVEDVVNELPVLHLLPVNDIPSNFYPCPLYSECNGTKHIEIKIPIAAENTESFWLQRGVHMILSQ